MQWQRNSSWHREVLQANKDEVSTTPKAYYLGRGMNLLSSSLHSIVGSWEHISQNPHPHLASPVQDRAFDFSASFDQTETFHLSKASLSRHLSPRCLLSRTYIWGGVLQFFQRQSPLCHRWLQNIRVRPRQWLEGTVGATLGHSYFSAQELHNYFYNEFIKMHWKILHF